MNIANVTSRFALISGLSDDEVYKHRALIDEACEYVSSLVVKSEFDKSDEKRLEMLSAAYALRLYCLCNNDNITSFVAGDVHITSPDGGDKAERLWQEYYRLCEDIVESRDFLFGRVSI